MQMFTTQTRFRLHTNISRNINSHQPSGLRFPLRLFCQSRCSSFSHRFSMPFLIDFWSILHPNLALKIDQNRSKIDAKMHSILDFTFGSIFGWCLVPTWTPWTEFGTSGLVPNAFFRVFWELDVWSHFGANLAPFWLPKSTKLQPKIDSKRHSKND